MSLILDALRRGRGRTTPKPTHRPAQTDAVLRTLGYSRFKSASPVNRFKRFTGLAIGGVLLILALWGAGVWLSNRSVVPASAPAFAPRASAAPAESQRDASAGQAPNAPAAPNASTFAPSGATVEKPAALIAPNQSAFAAKNEASTFAPAGATANKTADRPIAPEAALVGHSPRSSGFQAPPASPSGAPSSTALSTLATMNKVTIAASEDHFSRALYFHRLGDFENALFHYKQLLQRDELNAEAHNNLGLLYREKGLLDEAVKEFQRAIAIQPRYVRAHNNLGVAYLNQRKLDAASSEFHTALSIDPRNVESFVNLSTVEREEGRRDDARAAVVRALAIDPGNAEAHYNLGLIEDEAGNKQRALAHYSAFLQHGAAGYPNLVAEVRKRIETLNK